jgi:hypothetical protein
MAASKKKWIKLLEVPKTMILDGYRIRYRGHVLGYIKSGWGRGLWLTDKPKEWGTVRPWFPPEDKTIAEVADDLEVET